MDSEQKRPPRRPRGPKPSGKRRRKRAGGPPDPVRVEVQGCAARDLAGFLGQAVKEAGPRQSLMVIIVIAIVHAVIAFVSLIRR